MARSKRRIVITGLGPICALGVGIEPLWRAMCEGRSAIRRISRFDPSGFPCQIAAELADDQFDVKSVVPKSYRKATKVMARDIELAVGAAAVAVADAKLVTKATNPDVPPTYPPARLGCHIGAGLIAADIDELTAALVTSAKPIDDLRSAIDDTAPGDSTPSAQSSGGSTAIGVLNRQSSIVNRQSAFDLSHWGNTGMNNLTPLWLLKYLPNMLACHVTIIHDCQGPSNTITCSEASALLSMGESMRVIERGAADACLSGGAEFKINTMGLLRQVFAKRLAEANGEDDPTGVVRPFDQAATGSVLGEGGGLVVMEAQESAQQRGAEWYAVLAGFAATQSSCADTVGLEIEADGESIADAIEAALQAAEIKPQQIDAIVPLGLGIPHIDAAEAAAVRRVFGDRAGSIPLITTIPNVGNCCAGSGAISVAVAAMALRHQQLPARLNSRNVNGLDGAACEARAARLNHVLVTSSGMGGQNAAVVLSR